MRACGQERLDALHVAMETGFMQGGIAIPVRCINPRAVLQEQGEEGDVAPFRCRDERSCSLTVPGLDVGSAIEKGLGPGY